MESQLTPSSTQLSATEAAAYTRVIERGGWFELPDMRWMSFDGDKAVDVLNGLVTNDVALLQHGQAMYAAALTPKGKIVADMWIVRMSDTRILTGTSERAFAGWRDIVRKYVNPRLCKYADASDSTVARLVIGDVPAGATTCTVARGPMLGGLPTHFVIDGTPAASDGSTSVDGTSVDGTSVDTILESTFGPKAPPAVLDLLRIEAGLPQYGRDMNDNTLVQEANLQVLQGVSFEKGCYTGQETVARVHFRGHVNRHLRGLTSPAPLEPGGPVSAADGKPIGDVRSVAVSPRFGAIAIAMIRREVGAGETVIVGNDVQATVRSLPFS